MDAKLVGPFGPTQLGQGSTVLGRTQDNQIVVNDAKASSHHADIRFTGQDYTIADLGSTNGTYLNGQRLDRTPQVLHSGDSIRIGDTTYTFDQSNPPVPGAGMYGGSSPIFPPTQIAQSGYPDTAYGGSPGAPNYQPTQFASNAQQPDFQPYANQQNNYGSPQPQGSPSFDQYNQPQNGSSFNQYNQPPVAPYPPQGGQNVPYYGQAPTPTPYQQPPYQGGPAYGMPPTQPKKGGASRAIILIVLAFLVIVGGIAAYFGLRSHSTTTNTATPTATTTTANTGPTATAAAQSTGTTQVNATATAGDTVQDGSYATGTLALSDSMKDNSQGNKWDENDNCSFSQNVYEVKESSQNTFLTCFAENTNFSNFSYRVLTTIVSGDCSGIAFRGDTNSNKQYFFKVCQDGSYGLEIFEGNSGKYLIEPTSSDAVKQGLGKINDLAVTANNDTIQLYINGTMVNTTQDSSFSSGSIGVVAINDTSNGTDILFAGAKVWKN